MPRPVHFEIHADDTQRAIGFYTELFAWTFAQWGSEPYWLVTTGDSGPGINGGLLPRRGPRPDAMGPVNGYVCTIDVDNLDAYIARATSLGASVALPKMPIPSVGWLAYFKDTEGNVFGMMQADANAR
ncbi:MAG TPA: VOC family protein [Casimicrobiaceae bacterium]|nr:VOC family protein [Casimicrobiaceae bacterium]